MLDSPSIVRLYTNVLFNDMSEYGIVDDAAIRIGIKSMSEVYKADNAKQSASRSTVADFNDVAHRCAYLHKYAALHTAMVRDMMYSAATQRPSFFHHLVFSDPCFKICSLGGGPGSDVIGVLAALNSVLSYFDASVTIVDYMVNWSLSFRSILKELGSGSYNAFGDNMSNFLQWRYVGANLLKSLNPEVELEISTASLVTMIKFVSAASCKDTEFMVKNIFTAMKPGAVLFFIDNDGGGFRELIKKAADQYNFISIFGPFQHENYSNDLMKVRRFGSVSCSKTTVSVHILQKPYVSVSNTYCNPYTGYPERRVLLGPCGDAYPTLLDKPTFDGAITPLPHERAYPALLDSPFIDGPITPLPHERPYPAFIGGPITPLPHERYFSSYENQVNWVGQSTPLTPCVFQLDSNSGVVTPVTRNVVNSPNPSYRRQAIYSPETPRPAKRGRHGRKNGCLPLLRMKDWRHHLSSKIRTIKSAYSTFQRKNKKRNKKN